jgi:hypothetical protein
VNSKNIIKLFLAILIPVFVGICAYIEFTFAPYSDLKFKISDQSISKIYEPYTEVNYWKYNKKAKVNSLGLLGPEIVGSDKKLLLSIGTCTLLAIYNEMNTAIRERELNLDYICGSLGHLSIREVLIQLKCLLKEIKPDFLLVPLGTVFVRDIEFYNKDHYSVPERVIKERAFNYREGGLYQWLKFSWERRFNQLYFSSDRNEIKPYLLNKKKQNSFNPNETIKNNLICFTKDVIELARICRENEIELIIQTAPFNWKKSSDRQKGILEQFNNRLFEIAIENDFKIIDLSSIEYIRDSKNFYYDVFHLNKVGSKVVAEEVMKYIENKVL